MYWLLSGSFLQTYTTVVCSSGLRLTMPVTSLPVTLLSQYSIYKFQRKTLQEEKTVMEKLGES